MHGEKLDSYLNVFTLSVLKYAELRITGFPGAFVTTSLLINHFVRKLPGVNIIIFLLRLRFVLVFF